VIHPISKRDYFWVMADAGAAVLTPRDAQSGALVRLTTLG
jgi:hypothetical protein